MRASKVFFVFLLYLTLLGQGLNAQEGAPPLLYYPGSNDGVDVDTLYARDEFRIGVQAYNRFLYNEAIRSFERALSFRPGEPLILDWLGKAYYRSGIENTAFRVWQAAAEGYGFT